MAIDQLTATFREARAWADKVAEEYELGLRTNGEKLAAERAYRAAANALQGRAQEPGRFSRAMSEVYRLEREIWGDPINDVAPSECLRDLGRHVEAEAERIAQANGFSDLHELAARFRASVSGKYAYFQGPSVFANLDDEEE